MRIIVVSPLRRQGLTSAPARFIPDFSATRGGWPRAPEGRGFGFALPIRGEKCRLGMLPRLAVIRFGFLLTVDGLVAGIAEVPAPFFRNEEVWQGGGMRGVATEAGQLFSAIQWVGNFGNRMSWSRMSKAQRGIKLDSRNRFKIGLRDTLQVEDAYSIPGGNSRHVAGEAK